jgi:hypothetical protein
VLGGRVGPFLKWAPTADPADVPPAGYIGDGAAPHTVTGSDLGTNFVRIEAPGIGGANNPNPCSTTGPNAYTGAAADCIETNLFILMGKLSTRGGVDIARASYSRSSDGAPTQIDVYADSKAGQDIVVRDRSATPTFPITPLRAESGRYYAHVDVTGTLPAKVEVVNRGDTPQTVKSVPVEDLVTGTATYDSTTNTLHVRGKPSDKSSSAGTLTVPAFNKTLDATGTGDLTFVAPPDAVLVKSSSTFQWTYVRGANDPAITLGSTTGSTLSFTFPKTLSTLTFSLRVCNAAATPVCATTTVRIAGQPDPLTIARARFNGGRWVVAGTAGSRLQNSVTVHAGSTLGGPVIGTAVVDALGNYQLDVRNSPVPGNARVCLESARGGVLLNQPVR